MTTNHTPKLSAPYSVAPMKISARHVQYTVRDAADRWVCTATDEQTALRLAMLLNREGEQA